MLLKVDFPFNKNTWFQTNHVTCYNNTFVNKFLQCKTYSDKLLNRWVLTSPSLLYSFQCSGFLLNRVPLGLIFWNRCQAH